MQKSILLLGILLGQSDPLVGPSLSASKGPLAGAHAQTVDPNEPPEAFKPLDFSKIVGKYEINVTAEPTEVQVEGPIILRIAITGSGPAKYQPNRKDLRLFPDETKDPDRLPFAAAWKRDFYRQELIDQHEVSPDKKTWVFVYRLRPKHVKVKQIDHIRLSYYNPASPEENKYEVGYVPAIAIKVTPKPDPTEELEIAPPAAPTSFFDQPDPSVVLAASSPSFAPAGWLLTLLLVVPPLVCVAGVVAARRWFPDEAERVQQHRESAHHRAVEELQAGGSAWQVVCRFLCERLDFTVEDPTPAEVAAFLKRRGVALSVCRQAQSFFAACDAVRFTDASPQDGPAISDAIRLIQALEADPCV